MANEIYFKLLEKIKEGRQMKHDLQMLVTVEAEVGYLGNYYASFSAFV